MNFTYWIVDAVLALCCLSALYDGWKRGFLKIAAGFACLVLSLWGATWFAGHADNTFPQTAHAIAEALQMDPTQASFGIVSFFIAFLVIRFVLAILQHMIPKPKGHGLISTLNRILGVLAKAISMTFCLILLCLLLETNIFGVGLEYLNNTWLGVFDEVVSENIHGR